MSDKFNEGFLLGIVVASMLFVFLLCSADTLTVVKGEKGGVLTVDHKGIVYRLERLDAK